MRTNDISSDIYTDFFDRRPSASCKCGSGNGVPSTVACRTPSRQRWRAEGTFLSGVQQSDDLMYVDACTYTLLEFSTGDDLIWAQLSSRGVRCPNNHVLAEVPHTSIRCMSQSAVAPMGPSAMPHGKVSGRNLLPLWFSLPHSLTQQSSLVTVNRLA